MDKNQPVNLRRLFNLHASRFVADNPSIPDTELQGVMRALEENGLSYFHVDEAGRRERGDALTTLYAYDKQRLQGFLDRNKETLAEAEWPAEADQFVYYLSYVAAPANSAIFDLIYDCYGSRGHNIWLRRNAGTTSPHYIAHQRKEAEESKKKFLARHPDFK